VQQGRRRVVVDERPHHLSRALHRVGDVTSMSGVAALVAGLVVVYLLVLAIKGFPESWQVGFATFAGAVTLVMVFVIQHTQSREQLATQVKLDELIRATPRADDLYVHIEGATDEELTERHAEQVELHTTIRDS